MAIHRKAAGNRTVDRLTDVRAPHVIHHHCGWQGGKKRFQFRKITGLEVDHNMPAHGADPPGDFHQLVFWREVDQTFDEIETVG